MNAAGAAVAADSPTQDPQPQVSGAAMQTLVGPPNEQTSWTATVLLPTAGRAAPRANAHVKAHLMHFSAYSRGPNTLMVTNATTDAAGQQWVQVQLPTRPNLSTAWLPGSAVRLAQLHTHLRVRLAHRSVDVVQDGVTVSHFRAAVGTGGTPTPVGRFAVQDPVHSSPDQRSYLGPYIITLTAYSPVLRTFMGGPGLIAIHGTSAPQLLGQAVSHGCVRVSNGSVSKLWRVVTPGMPVEITRS
ncbi:MAG: L,D-transpeptidase [Thermoleophilia bacterium]